MVRRRGGGLGTGPAAEVPLHLWNLPAGGWAYSEPCVVAFPFLPLWPFCPAKEVGAERIGEGVGEGEREWWGEGGREWWGEGERERVNVESSWAIYCVVMSQDLY